jgi:hypothetical protein
MATTIPAIPISPTDAAREAFEHTRRQLFPFRFGRWLTLGFLAFLDQCGRTLRGGGPGGGGHGHGVVRDAPVGDWTAAQEWLRQAAAWLGAHAAPVALAALAGLLLVALLLAVVLWVNARGVFMYLDNVASGRADVSRPWRQHADAASSYFGWSLGISLAGLFVLIFVLGIVATVVLAFTTGRAHGSGGWLGAAAIAPVLALLLLALPLLGLAAIALRDFVAPLQLATGLPCGPAARVLEGLVMSHPGAFVLYLILKLVVVVVSGIVVTVFGCLTCCLGFLPVVMQTAFQPLFYFERAFSICLLRQMGYDASARLSS